MTHGKPAGCPRGCPPETNSRPRLFSHETPEGMVMVSLQTCPVVVPNKINMSSPSPWIPKTVQWCCPNCNTYVRITTTNPTPRMGGSGLTLVASFARLPSHSRDSSSCARLGVSNLIEHGVACRQETGRVNNQAVAQGGTGRDGEGWGGMGRDGAA